MLRLIFALKRSETISPSLEFVKCCYSFHPNFLTYLFIFSQYHIYFNFRCIVLCVAFFFLLLIDKKYKYPKSKLSKLQFIRTLHMSTVKFCYRFLVNFLIYLFSRCNSYLNPKKPDTKCSLN